jgi:hypothetical protein
MKTLAVIILDLILVCPFVVGPLCFMLILAKWFGRRVQQDREMSAYNWRLAVSLIIWIPLTGFMCLLALFTIMADPCEDPDPVLCPPPTLVEIATWLSIPVVYICVGAGLVYLMWASIKRPLR